MTTPAAGRSLLITAGPTHEPIDAVRYLGNRSSGRLGVALADEGARRGWRVTLLLGPVAARPEDSRVRVRSFRTCEDLRGLLGEEVGGADVLIMAAAVADYRPRTVSPVKMSRVAGAISIELEPTEDIAAAACARRSAGQVVVGFSLEREGDVERAVKKMKTKGLDMIVFNPLATMGAEDVVPLLLYPDGRQEVLGRAGKGEFAKVLVARAVAIAGGGA